MRAAAGAAQPRRRTHPHSAALTPTPLRPPLAHPPTRPVPYQGTNRFYGLSTGAAAGAAFQPPFCAQAACQAQRLPKYTYTAKLYNGKPIGQIVADAWST